MGDEQSLAVASLLDSSDRHRLHQRIDRLTPGAARRWGRMTVQQMVCHLIDSVEGAWDPDTEPPGTGLLSKQPLKWLVLSVLPWPKGKMESPERLTRRTPGEWSADVAALHGLIDRLAERPTSEQWPASEVFGPLSRDQWGALLHAHINHHLTQFGV
jgi:hypothetical protein